MDRKLNAFSAKGNLLASAAFHYLPGTVRVVFNEYKAEPVGPDYLPDVIVPYSHHVTELEYEPFDSVGKAEAHDRAFISGMLRQDLTALGPIRFAYTADAVHTRCLAFSSGHCIGLFDIAAYILEHKKQISFISAEAAEYDRSHWVDFFDNNEVAMAGIKLDPAIGPFSVETTG
ncbi:hypothetical protein EPD60_13740 [Flaviaesturariibacter flavus]|uniref:Uncharacterized protein n=1 Tax=Flaviaesturariibacter flavus TaxID=2502780 RepID=A0A4R1B7P7_9BACT|nr:hypothetical protein [Flaviaesturariibacter flavus]TCJ13127.1 hypothetical protein EPD60_13740 [Flaviaesturariibacter flavus]